MSKFSFNESDSAHTMMQNLDAYILSIKKDKYKLILDFMNDLFDKNHTTLKKFVNMSYAQLDNDVITNTIEKHKENIKKKLRVEVKIDDKSNLKQYVFKLIKDMLKVIDYKLTKTEKYDKYYYTILDKPSKISSI